jgi:hypothetical protein
MAVAIILTWQKLGRPVLKRPKDLGALTCWRDTWTTIRFQNIIFNIINFGDGL